MVFSHRRAAAGVVRARGQGPDDQYIQIYNLIQEADKLNNDLQPGDALPKYLEAQTALQRFQKGYPDWNPTVIGFRLSYVAAKITALSGRSRPSRCRPSRCRSNCSRPGHPAPAAPTPLPPRQPFPLTAPAPATPPVVPTRRDRPSGSRRPGRCRPGQRSHERRTTPEHRPGRGDQTGTQRLGGSNCGLAGPGSPVAGGQGGARSEAQGSPFRPACRRGPARAGTSGGEDQEPAEGERSAQSQPGPGEGEARACAGYEGFGRSATGPGGGRSQARGANENRECPGTRKGCPPSQAGPSCCQPLQRRRTRSKQEGAPGGQPQTR